MVNEKVKESRKIVLLKDRLDYIFTNFTSNFNSTGKNFLKKLAKYKEKIGYSNLFSEIEDPDINSYDFFEIVGTLYDLLINLLNEIENLLNSSNMQFDLNKLMFILKSIIQKKIENIADKIEKQKKKENFAAPISILTNLTVLIK